MKKLFIVLAAASISLGTVAQENKMQDSKMQNEKKMKDELIMKDGKMWVMKEGKSTMMDKDMTMTNGSIVSPNGMVKMSDGTTTQMKNGDKMDMTGKMMEKKMEKKIEKK